MGGANIPPRHSNLALVSLSCCKVVTVLAHGAAAAGVAAAPRRMPYSATRPGQAPRHAHRPRAPTGACGGTVRVTDRLFRNPCLRQPGLGLPCFVQGGSRVSQNRGSTRSPFRGRAGRGSGRSRRRGGRRPLRLRNWRSAGATRRTRSYPHSCSPRCRAPTPPAWLLVSVRSRALAAGTLSRRGSRYVGRRDSSSSLIVSERPAPDICREWVALCAGSGSRYWREVAPRAFVVLRAGGS